MPVAGTSVTDDLVAQHVEHLVEARTRIDRHLQRMNLRPEAVPDLCHQRLEIILLLVEPGDKDDAWDAELAGIIPHHLGPHPDAVAGMDDDQRKVGDTQGVDRLTREVEVAGRIDKIETPPLPFAVERRSVDGDVPLLFAHVIIRHGGALGDAAHAIYDSAAL